MTDFKIREDRDVLKLFSKRDIALIRGRGARVWDEQGNEYIDCTSGHGVAAVGHANPKVARAIAEQAEKLITCSGSFYNPQRAALAQKLVAITPGNLTRVFFCNSGTESVEAALKFARISSGKSGIVAAMRGFHGRTLGALSATHNPKYRAGFEPLVPDFRFVPFNHFQKLAAAVDQNTAAIILEIVQGEGGVNIGERAYFEQVQNFCRRHNILLIIDEVQTGFGRTGSMFACGQYNLEPDLLCLSKALGGGFPIGAVICSNRIHVPTGKHGTTFGGNPLAAAAALATIQYIEDHNLPEQAAEKGKHFAQSLRAQNLTRVREVRQIGLMIGIELREKVQPYILRLQQAGVLAIPAGAQVIRLLPPLVISDADMDTVMDRLVHVLTNAIN